jgi:hypothetical protein
MGAPRREREVVTVLFADLVGFTARLRAAEQLSGAAAQAQLEPALAFYRNVGATRYVRQAEALLPASA